MSKETNSIQMLIQGRKLTLQQRGDAQRELNNIQSKLSELEKKNNELLKSHSDWMSVALERKDEITKLNEIIKEAINLPKGVEPHSYSDYLTNNTNK